MAISINATPRNAMVSALIAALDAGSGPATVQIRSGTRPANVTVAATGTLLVTVTLNDPSFGTPANGVAAITTTPANPTGTAVAAGTASWARVFDSDGNAIFDAGVGTTGQEFLVNTTNVLVGSVLNLTAGSITLTVT